LHGRGTGMKIRKILINLPCVAAGFICAIPVQAQPYLQPSISVGVLVDDNILVTAADPFKDRYTRISPALEAGIITNRLNARTYYTRDIEKYDKYPEFDASDMRESLDAAVSYQLTNVIELSLNGRYDTSRIPAELNISTGVGEGREQARRLLINPAMRYLFSETSSGLLEYQYTHEQLDLAAEAEINAVNVEYLQRVSAVSELIYGYTFTHYAFDGVGLVNGQSQLTEYVHSPRVGIVHALTQFSSVTAQIGPRFSGDEVGVDFAARYQRASARSIFSIGYERSAASLIGEQGLAELDVFSVSLTHELNNALRVGLIGNYSDVRRDGSGLPETSVMRLGVDALYRINDHVSLTASYEHSKQRSTIGSLRSDIPRNVAMLALTLTIPRRGAGATRQPQPL